MGLEDRAAGKAGTPLAGDDSAPPPVHGPEARLPVAEATVLDLLAHELRRDGRPIPLRPKEYQLLATLAANPGRAFSRRQLLDLAWDRDRDIDTRTVDVHRALAAGQDRGIASAPDPSHHHSGLRISPGSVAGWVPLTKR